jgi:hypothetical protein
MKWQRIETAPKDGTKVLLWDGMITTGEWCENPHPWNDGKWWIEGGQITGNPTHWMPLPEKPENE